MKKMILYFLSAFITTVVFAHPQIEQCEKIVRRAAFDIGSGKIKLQISEVDLTTNKIVRILFTDTVNVALREDLTKSTDGKFSLEIQNKTVDAIRKLIQKSKPFQPEAYHAIGTEPFRLAKNGSDLAERITKDTGLTLSIISQEEEGILGFITAVNVKKIDLDKAVSWDLGGGSFQLTTKCGNHYATYLGRIGKISAKDILLKIQGKDPLTLSPNPISKSQASQAIQYIKDSIKDISDELCQKLNQPDTVVIGIGINPLWGMHCTDFDSKKIFDELDRRLELDDNALVVMDAISPDRKEVAAYIVSNLILGYAILEAFQIPQVHYVETQGANAIGLLLSPNYWNSDKSQKDNMQQTRLQ